VAPKRPAEQFVGRDTLLGQPLQRRRVVWAAGVEERPHTLTPPPRLSKCLGSRSRPSPRQKRHPRAGAPRACGKARVCRAPRPPCARPGCAGRPSWAGILHGRPVVSRARRSGPQMASWCPASKSSRGPSAELPPRRRALAGSLSYLQAFRLLPQIAALWQFSPHVVFIIST